VSKTLKDSKEKKELRKGKKQFPTKGGFKKTRVTGGWDDRG
jgi:hypothetical protein